MAVASRLPLLKPHHLINLLGDSGFYQDSHGHNDVFVVSERNGTWHRAIEVPGLAALNNGGLTNLSAVSCGAAGNCAAVGYYTDGLGHQPGRGEGSR
jgi:hypothetical protein